jgi:hypothetical protein
MATKGTGKMDQPSITALMTNKTISIAGDGSESEDFRNLRGDASTQVLGTIDFAHHEIHAGDFFHVADSATINAASSDSVDYLIVVPNTTKWPHMVIDADGSIITSFALYEDCTAFATSDGYTQLTAYNANRNSSNDATTQIWVKEGSSDASSDFGTVIYEYSAGSTTAQSRMPSVTRARNEWILGQGVKYIFRILSASASNLVNVLFSWYEHTNES